MDNVAGMVGSANLDGMLRIEEERIRSHVGEVVRETVEQTLNGLLQAEADELCGATRYARSPERLDTSTWSPVPRSLRLAIDNTTGANGGNAVKTKATRNE